MVANVIEKKMPPSMEMDQWWRLWHRTGHRWIEKCNKNVLTAIRERVLRWAGHVARMHCSEVCAKALRCWGLQWWRWRQLHSKEVDKDKWAGPLPKRLNIFRRQTCSVECWSFDLKLILNVLTERERVGLERGYDRPGPDADIDAHSTGYGENGVGMVCTSYSRQEDGDAQQGPEVSDGWTGGNCWRAS